MSEEARLTALATRLVEDWHEGRVPTLRVNHNDAAAIACGLHFEMDRRTDARRVLAHQQGVTIVCKKGCSACCESLVMVMRAESVAIAEWLDDPAHQDIRAWFLNEAYPRWRAEIGDALEKAQDSQRADDGEGYAQAVLDVWQRRVMCAFNRDDLCTIYAVRPNACRNSHALHTSENCVAEKMQAPETLDFEEIQKFRFGTRPLTESLHQVLGGVKGVLSSVCQEVYELLTESAEPAPAAGSQAGSPEGPVSASEPDDGR